MTTKQLIKEYIDDHFKHFGFYPYDVEVDGVILSYGNYWSILEDEIQSSREVIAEYTDNHRLKCDDGSDDFIEGNYHIAQRLLLKIEEWEN